MKTEKYTGIICKGFCSFYKEGKEALACETYNFLANRFTPEALESSTHNIEARPDLSCDKDIKAFICERCDFLMDGCDFRDGRDAEPCGGYTVIEGLIKKGIIKLSGVSEKSKTL